MPTDRIGTQPTTPTPMLPHGEDPVVEREVAAGFIAPGQPLPDDAVWNIFIGEDKRPLNTADAHFSKQIDGYEQRQLLKLATQDPKGFITRLLADSMNGTPVSLKMTKEFENLGVLSVDFSAEDGRVQTDVSFEVYAKLSDKFLKPYTVPGSRPRGERSGIKISLSGELKEDASVENIQISASLNDLPKLDADKLTELDQLRKAFKSSMRETAASRRTEGATAAFEEAIARMAEFPLHFLLDQALDNGADDALVITVKEKDDPTAATAELGDGKYAITFDDILGDAGETDEPKVTGHLAGEVELQNEEAYEAVEGKAALSIEEAKIETAQPLSLNWQGDEPVLSRVDPATGEKTPVQESAAQLLQYLPLLIAYANNIPEEF